MAERKCAACGHRYLLTYNRRRKEYRCMSLLRCDERVEEWYKKHRKS